MLLSELKEQIKKQIDVINDDSILLEIEDLLKVDAASNDWFASLNENAKEGILAGYNDWKEGSTFSHQIVMQDLRK